MSNMNVSRPKFLALVAALAGCSSTTVIKEQPQPQDSGSSNPCAGHWQLVHNSSSSDGAVTIPLDPNCTSYAEGQPPPNVPTYIDVSPDGLTATLSNGDTTCTQVPPKGAPAACTYQCSDYVVAFDPSTGAQDTYARGTKLGADGGLTDCLAWDWPGTVR